MCNVRLLAIASIAFSVSMQAGCQNIAYVDNRSPNADKEHMVDVTFPFEVKYAWVEILHVDFDNVHRARISKVYPHTPHTVQVQLQRKDGYPSFDYRVWATDMIPENLTPKRNVDRE